MAGHVIRPSSLVTYLDCPRRWAARHLTDLVTGYGYRLQADRPVHVGAAVGSGVHAGAGWTMAQKRSTGELGNRSEAEDRAIEELKARMEYGVSWDVTTTNLGVARTQVMRMTHSYRAHLAPLLEPITIEERLEADIGDGWTLSGAPDTLAGNPDEKVRDTKTGVVQRSNGVQYGAYYMLFEAHGYRPTAIVEDFIQRTRLDKETPPPRSTTIPLATTVADTLEAIDDIKRSTRRFEDRMKGDTTGRAPPSAFRANPASVLCGAKWCRAHGTDFCHAHKRD